jgi:hypothetical protein
MLMRIIDLQRKATLAARYSQSRKLVVCICRTGTLQGWP